MAKSSQSTSTQNPAVCYIEWYIEEHVKDGNPFMIPIDKFNLLYHNTDKDPASNLAIHMVDCNLHNGSTTLPHRTGRNQPRPWVRVSHKIFLDHYTYLYSTSSAIFATMTGFSMIFARHQRTRALQSVHRRCPQIVNRRWLA